MELAVSEKRGRPAVGRHDEVGVGLVEDADAARPDDFAVADIVRYVEQRADVDLVLAPDLLAGGRWGGRPPQE
jgi:hypothetical protein